jgi:hypothetical protein
VSSFTVDTAGIRALRESLNVADFEGVVSDAIAEGAILFEERIRPLTPFDTGLLLMSGNLTVEPLAVEFENDAEDPGGTSYASFAHRAGDPRRGSADGSILGGYGEDVREVFLDELGHKTAARIKDSTAKQLRG